MTPVSSSQIQSVGYDENLQDLYVEFKKGTVYRYFDVPWAVFDRLSKADSVGSYFGKTIKGVYEYKRIEVLVTDDGILQLSN